MTSIANSANMVALVQASTTLPIMLFSLPAGAIADNYDRRKVMLAAQIFLLVVSIGLSASTYLGLITPLLLLTFTFLIGCGTALNGPAWQSSVGEMVPRPDLPAAIALNSIGFNITRSFGPAIGGVIVAAAGAAAAFAVNSVSYVALIAVLFRWRPVRTAAALPRESLGTRDGRRAALCRACPPISRRCCCAALSSASPPSRSWRCCPWWRATYLNGGPLLYGILLGAFGSARSAAPSSAPGCAETLSAEWLVVRRSPALPSAPLAVAIAPNAWLTAERCCSAAPAGCWRWRCSTSPSRCRLPRWVVGRALALYQTATFGGMALGSWALGRASPKALDPPRPCSLPRRDDRRRIRSASSWPLPDRAQNLDLDQPLDRAPSALDLKPRSGPIVITIEYMIRQENTRLSSTS